MKNIKILGTGCIKCKRTEELVRRVVEEMGIDAQIEKVEDIRQIMEYNILSTPAVVIDGIVKIKGRVPDRHELETLLADVQLA
ncbi:MAG: TM0996/MTH895 family glutaredoxin-like protein [Saprospirales bacterium]|jgi:small redox-active disulfide protein 2|nr:TM0996/MTH895 family glutaredoxin-like protein [Saprospirales bacterium]MBK6902234.1 TM0996/MTH895 family glutaredoxin-like protein [Saprospirales bacterium]MBK7335351.1 TM0996/MTH895 family glutaredoxin-like protein [Saprospirales bacterium]